MLLVYFFAFLVDLGSEFADYHLGKVIRILFHKISLVVIKSMFRKVIGYQEEQGRTEDIILRDSRRKVKRYSLFVS